MAKAAAKKTAKKAGVRTRRKTTSGRDAGPASTPDLTRVHIWQIQAVRDLLWVAALVGIVWLGYLLRAVTVPLLVALLLAYLFEPLVARWAQRPNMNRTRVLVLLLSTAGVVAALIIAIGATLAVNQASRLVDDVESGRFRARLSNVRLPEVVHDPYYKLLDRVWPPDAETEPPPAVAGDDDEAADATPMTAAVPPPLTEERVRQIIREEQPHAGRDPAEEPEGWQALPVSPRAAATAFLKFAGSFLQAGFLLFLIPFYFFFFSLWYQDVVHFARSLIPVNQHERALDLLGKMDRAVAGFVRGRLVISVIMGLMLAVGWMVCGVPYSIALGIVIGVFCAVPYLGVIGVPVSIALLWFDSIGPDGTLTASIWWILLAPSIVFGIVQLIEGYVLTPMIAGKATNLDPVTILVAVLAGGALMGVYGMLLAIPIAACLKIIATEVMLPKIKDWTAGRASDPLPIDRD